MSKGLALKMLDIAASKADAAEVIVDSGESSSVHFENNRLKYIDTRGILGVGVRVIHRGRIGFSGTTDLEEPGRVVQDAIDSAAFGQEARFQFPAPQYHTADPHVEIYDPAVLSFPIERRIEICKAAIDRLLARDAKLDCAAGVDTAHSERHIANTSGLSVDLKGTDFDAGIYALRVSDDGSLTHMEDGNGSRRVLLQMDKHVDDVLKQIDLSQRVVPWKPGKMPVIFIPKAIGLLLATFTSNVNGKSLQKGTSLFIGRLGEKILDERVTLWDDGLVDFAPASLPFDGEGTPCRKMPLFEAGVFKNFIFDLQTAGITANAPTGNASRSFASQPGPGHHNIRLAPGETPCADMLADLKQGLIVYQVLGGGQSNVLAGEFSVNIDLGFLIENGRIVGRVKDAMLAGNAFDAFKNIAAISRETEWRGSVELPYVCFKELSVVGAQQ